MPIDDTPQDGFEVDDPAPRRRMTAPGGIPIQVPALDPDPLISIIDGRVAAASRRSIARLWRGIAAIGGVALGALIAAGSSALDDRERRGVEREQQRTVARDLERLRFEVDSLRAAVYAPSHRWSRADQPEPDRAIMAPLPSKGPTP